ncbi:unnamed protein product [Litomosoides sigmodontis]|uniref:PH domain-containing protein n=1 Tax=Litomosoides sigmodontis TaxID=42156 RepID=A0A3P6V9I2_LITSI|nr:unnamed protein product [Litomosoides sigmodontis]
MKEEIFCLLALKIRIEPSKDTRWSPILPLSTLIAKEKANDKRALFIVNTMERGAQIYELVTTTATERKTWFKLISDQIDLVKSESVSTPQSTIGSFGVNAAVSGEQFHADDMELCARVEISTHPQLVNASEITIQQPTILEHAQPILTPTERLRRNDDVIVKALLEKQTILAEFLPGSSKSNIDELEKLTEELTGMDVTKLKQRDGQELAMSAIVHGNRLLDAINQGLSVRKGVDDANSGAVVLKLDNVENDVPTVACYKLTAIAAPLMNHLKAMMQELTNGMNEIVGKIGENEEAMMENVEMIAESVDCDKQVLSDAEAERRKRLQTKRQRNTALTLSNASINPHASIDN